MTKTVAFLYGLGEGKWHSRQLRRQLTAAGYEVIGDPKQADILVAHSGGCLLVPADGRAELVLLAGYTYWPGRSLIASHWQRQRAGLQTYRLRWLGLNTMNLLYLFNLGHTWRLAKVWPKRSRQLQGTAQAHLVFVRERFDEFCDPLALLQNQPGNCYVSLPGYHDDCWLHPTPYINLLQSEV